MSNRIKVQPLTAEAFAPFGDVMDASGAPDKLINQGKCGRFHNKARLDFSDGAAGISIFQGEVETLPLKLEMVERHPDGSQAFVPMSLDPFLVVVATDEAGVPTNPQAFITETGQAIIGGHGTES